MEGRERERKGKRSWTKGTGENAPSRNKLLVTSLFRRVKRVSYVCGTVVSGVPFDVVVTAVTLYQLQELSGGGHDPR